MHSLPAVPKPTYTLPGAYWPATRVRASAYVTLVMSVTATSTVVTSDLISRINLQPASVGSPHETNTTSLEQGVAAVAPEPSWLETTIDEILAGIPDEAWTKARRKKIANLDKHL
jgi:hypothetical protein